MKRSYECMVRKKSKRMCLRTTRVLPTPKGAFEGLPEEVTQHIFASFSSLRYLSALATTSQSMCQYIRYLTIDTQLVIRPINEWIQQKDYKSIQTRFVEIGMLIRATTALQPLEEKLDTVEMFLYELEVTYHRICEKISLRFAYDCIGLFLYRVIVGWKEPALRKVFELINRLSRMKERIDKVIYAPHTDLQHYQRDIREFITEVFLKKAISPNQQALWLSLLMKMYPNWQPKLLFILYGPLKNYSERSVLIDWELLVTCSSFHAKASYHKLKELADVISLILSSPRFCWNDATFIKFFNELTMIPEPWCLENSAKLMFLLGHHTTVRLLQHKLSSDKTPEFSHLAFHLAQVSAKNSGECNPDSLHWFISVMTESIGVLSAPSRRSNAVHQVFKAWRENVQSLAEELDDAIDEIDEVREDLNVAISNLTAVAQILLDSALNARNHYGANEE